MDEIDFESDDFADIIAKDSRYHPHAYALLMDVVHYLGEQGSHMSGEEVLEEFKERSLDQYGPLAYTLLAEWGVSRCEDVGEMMFNLVEFHRVAKDPEDSSASFLGGYDFKEAFFDPYMA